MSQGAGPAPASLPQAERRPSRSQPRAAPARSSARQPAGAGSSAQHGMVWQGRVLHSIATHPQRRDSGEDGGENRGQEANGDASDESRQIRDAQQKEGSAEPARPHAANAGWRLRPAQANACLSPAARSPAAAGSRASAAAAEQRLWTERPPRRGVRPPGREPRPLLGCTRHCCPRQRQRQLQNQNQNPIQNHHHASASWTESVPYPLRL
jgi:hypothetical protein